MKKLIAVLFLSLTFSVPSAQAMIIPHIVKGVLVLIPILAKYNGTNVDTTCYEKRPIQDGSGNDTNATSNSAVDCK